MIHMSMPSPSPSPSSKMGPTSSRYCMPTTTVFVVHAHTCQAHRTRAGLPFFLSFTWVCLHAWSIKKFGPAVRSPPRYGVGRGAQDDRPTRTRTLPHLDGQAAGRAGYLLFPSGIVLLCTSTSVRAGASNLLVTESLGKQVCAHWEMWQALDRKKKNLGRFSLRPPSPEPFSRERPLFPLETWASIANLVPWPRRSCILWYLSASFF